MSIGVLKHPETDEVRYVGITTARLDHRLFSHICVAKNGIRHTHKDCWICSLLNNGLRPVIEIIEETPIDDLNAKEVEYIAKFKDNGIRLTNSTSGGQANFTVSEETKAKQRALKIGKPLTLEHRKNIALAQIGSKHTEETKAKMSESALGRTNSPEHCGKISKTHKSKSLSKGENNNNSKLTEVQVLEIYDKIKNGYKDKKLATEY